MFAAVVLAATTSVATQFFDDFAGRWLCRSAHATSYWSIARPAGSAWTIVTWGADPNHAGGRAYVGWLAQKREYVYDDFHNDGSLAQLHAAAPSDHRYVWTGAYYAARARRADRSGRITWTLAPNGSIERRYARIVDARVVPQGNDTCTKTTPCALTGCAARARDGRRGAAPRVRREA